MSNLLGKRIETGNHYNLPESLETVYIYLMSHFEEEMASSIRRTGYAIVMLYAGLKNLDQYGQMGEYERTMIKSMILALENIDESFT